MVHEQKMHRMEEEMRTVFQQKVQEKERKLMQIEEEVGTFHFQLFVHGSNLGL
jgi:septin 7